MLFVIAGIIIVCGVLSCNSPSSAADNEEPFYKLFAAGISRSDANAKSTDDITTAMYKAYAARNNKPFWISGSQRCFEHTYLLIEEFRDLRWDGADSLLWGVDSLYTALVRLDTNKVHNLDMSIRLDTMLTRRYLAASRFLLLGKINPKKVDSLWYVDNDTVWNAADLLVEAYDTYPALSKYRSKIPQYRLMREEYEKYSTLCKDTSYLNAVYNIRHLANEDSVFRTSAHYIMQSDLPWFTLRHYDTITDAAQLVNTWQYYYGLSVTGIIDKATIEALSVRPTQKCKTLRINLERMRWMRQDIGNTYVIVDVPLAVLAFKHEGVKAMYKRVVVGKTARQTPSLNAMMTDIVVNPPWTVPPTILRKDVVPGVAKEGQAYLSRKGLYVVDKNGKRVSASSVNRKNYHQYTFRQPPGRNNSLGSVKFNMPNKWNIYLHDTPHREDFAKSYRALSSGCVRLHQPKELALYILSEMEAKSEYTPGKLDSIIDTHKTKWLRLKNKIPVYITYLTVFQDSSGSHLRYAADVYNRDKRFQLKAAPGF